MKRALRIVYVVLKCSFNEFPEDDSCKIHEKNLEKLVTENFEVKNEFSPTNYERCFETAECPYSLKNDLKRKL